MEKGIEERRICWFAAALSVFLESAHSQMAFFGVTKIKEIICHIRPIELRSGPIVAEVVDNSFVATNKAIKISVIVKV